MAMDVAYKFVIFFDSFPIVGPKLWGKSTYIPKQGGDHAVISLDSEAFYHGPCFYDTIPYDTTVIRQLPFLICPFILWNS